MTFKLQLHLIPETCFGFNLRNHLGGNQWNKLSKQIRLERNYTCDICKATRQPKYMHLHEVWEFKNGIQKLVGFECVCSTCHDVHHWGLSQVRNKDMYELMMHACDVNGCMEHEFEQHIRKSFEIWRERSCQEWKLDLNYMNSISIEKKTTRSQSQDVQSQSGLVIKMHRKKR